MSKRKKYSTEFKREAVELSHQSNVSVSQVAREIGVRPNLLSRWRRELASEPAAAFKGSGSPRDAELASLKRELSRVKKERDFLKEAATFFAKESS